MKTFITASTIALLICTSALAHAEYIGPNGQATSVKQLQEIGRDHDYVHLNGYIIQRSNLDDNLYEFSDGTASILIEIGHKHWPIGLKVDHKTKVEIIGEYDRELIGLRKIEVEHLRVVQ